MEKEGRPAAEVVLTVLHAGGKFGEGGGYKVSGGLHGVGVSVVNALSERLALTIWREGHEWTQPYERGAPMSELAKGAKSDRHGTSITFLPDLEIFETIDYDRTVLEQRFREMAFLTRGLKIDFRDERGERFETSFQYDGGIVDFVKYLHSQGTREPLHPKIVYVQDDQRRGRGRGRAPVEQLLPGGAPLVRQQHQHARGRHAPLGLPLGAHQHDQQLRAPDR